MTNVPVPILQAGNSVGPELRSPTIYKFQPFSIKKELGKEYNAHCSIVPHETDWILILDYDAMILDPSAYTIMEKAIETHPDVQIFTAYGSRIGYHQQRLDPYKIETNDSILFHQDIARKQAAEWPNGECTDITSAAGFFLLFRKSYWQANPFQDKIIDESGRLFDWNFCLSAMKNHQIRLIRGIYVWHSYRLGNPNMRETNHLQ